MVDDETPVRILIVTGRGDPAAMPAARRASFAGFRKSTAPRPLRSASACTHPFSDMLSWYLVGSAGQGRSHCRSGIHPSNEARVIWNLLDVLSRPHVLLGKFAASLAVWVAVRMLRALTLLVALVQHSPRTRAHTYCSQEGK